VNNQNYTATIEGANSPKNVFKHTNDVSKYWAKILKGRVQ